MHFPSPARNRWTAALCAAALVAGAPTAFGQYTWTGGANANWNNTANWTGGVPVSGADTTITFDSATSNRNTIQNVAGLFSLNSVTFGTNAQNYSIGGNPLDFRTTGSPCLRFRTCRGTPRASCRWST